MRLMNVKRELCLVLGFLSSSAFSVDLNSTISINYGTVEKVEQAKLDSLVGQGVVAGGMIGAVSGKHDRAKHAAEGAAAVGLLAALAQGSRKAFSYQVKLSSGGEIKLVTENGGIATGDCVSIEQGKTANIRRVSSVYCEDPNGEALQHPHVQASALEDAAECHTAKEIALNAKTEKDVDIALKKVRAFCGS